MKCMKRKKKRILLLQSAAAIFSGEIIQVFKPVYTSHVKVMLSNSHNAFDLIASCKVRNGLISAVDILSHQVPV